MWLERLGAEITGLALPAGEAPTLFDAGQPWCGIKSILGDLRDRGVAAKTLGDARPEIVLHLAAQALVRPSYDDPSSTFATNVDGTINLLEAVRRAPSVCCVLVVTSDKVYLNTGSGTPFAESAPLGGSDPYSASKSCQEVVAASYRDSFLHKVGVTVATARAGNVIGGGDWGMDRLVPDCVRAATDGRDLLIRYPNATRPWQHVLDCLSGYLLYVERLMTGEDLPLALNFGPDGEHVWTVGRMVERIQKRWALDTAWIRDGREAPPEAPMLSLDSALARRSIGWRPRLALEDAIDWTVDWYIEHAAGVNMRDYCHAQIDRYQALP